MGRTTFRSAGAWRTGAGVLLVGLCVLASSPAAVGSGETPPQSDAAPAPSDAAARPAAPPAAELGWQVLDRRVGEGEQCLVCGQRIDGIDIVEVRYQGRTFFVAEPMLPQFEADPEAYFRRIQARSALFDEAAVRARPIATGWLVAGLYVLAGLICGALAAYVAVGKALAPLPWFVAGLLGNVVGLGAVIARPTGDASALPAGVPAGLAKVATTRAPAPCPACGALNHPSAAGCASCGASLTPTVRPETERV